MKKYYTGTWNGKYTLHTHDGKTHPDGSEFYDIEFFRNKKKLAACVKNLQKDGYIKKTDWEPFVFLGCAK